MHQPTDRELRVAKRYHRMMRHLTLTLPDPDWEPVSLKAGNAKGWLWAANKYGQTRKPFAFRVRNHNSVRAN